MVRGSLLSWNAVGKHTSLETWVGVNLETLLGPYTVPATGRGAQVRSMALAPAGLKSAKPPRRRAPARRVRAAS
jgi:hypothetical protein